jgi:hypothetical protein
MLGDRKEGIKEGGGIYFWNGVKMSAEIDFGKWGRTKRSTLNMAKHALNGDIKKEKEKEVCS